VDDGALAVQGEVPMTGATSETMSETWGRARACAAAAREYCRLVAEAWRAWIYGAIAAGAGMGLSVAVGLTMPLWALAAVPVAILIAVQFYAFVRVRQQREEFNRAKTLQTHLDAIAALRSRENAFKSRAIYDQASYLAWKSELVALRQEIHDRIARGISRAEAETFHTVGNLHHAAGGGVNDEHNMLLSVVMRDLDHLAELIHGYARFERD
jgi:hypothetical protein